MATLLCQFTSDAELTERDIISLQPEDNHLTVANHWHLKTIYELHDWLNPLLRHYERAGYFSSIEGKTIEDERRDEISDLFMEFVRDNKIDAFQACPQCGENTTAARIRINGACPDCHMGAKAAIVGAFGNSI